MKLFDEWKLKRECQKLGRTKEYDDYLKSKESLARDKSMYERFINDAKEKFLSVKKVYREDTKEYIASRDEVNRWKYALEQTVLKAQFVRPNNPDDIKYRERIIDEFSEKIENILGDDSSIRFHGTPIYYAKEILKNNGIFSSSSRYEGYNSSTDLEDEISVTTSKTINRTLSYFTDFYAFQSSLPAGCLFVLRDNGEEDAKLIKYAAMKSFNFKEHPERFLGICTTSENIPRVRKWLKDYGYSEKLAYTFDEFLTIAHQFKESVPKSNSEEEKEHAKTFTDVEKLIEELDDEKVNQIIEQEIDVKPKTR